MANTATDRFWGFGGGRESRESRIPANEGNQGRLCIRRAGGYRPIRNSKKYIGRW